MIHRTMESGPGKTTCPMTCVIFADAYTEDKTQGCLVEFCSDIRNLCLVATPQVAQRTGASPLDTVLRYAPHESRCLELHMGFHNLGCPGAIGFPSLVPARTTRACETEWGSFLSSFRPRRRPTSV